MDHSLTPADQPPAPATPSQPAPDDDAATHTAAAATLNRLSPDQVVDIWRLRQRGLKQADIAAIVGCSQGTVSRWLDALEHDTTEAAQQLYAANQLRAAQAVLRRLEDQDGKVALKAAELTHRVGGLLDTDQPVQVGVQLVIGAPPPPQVTD